MSNESNIDPKKLQRMTLRILKTEQENLRTRARTKEQMVESIRKTIMQESKKTN